MPAPTVNIEVVETKRGRRAFKEQVEDSLNSAISSLYDEIQSIPAGPQGPQGEQGPMGALTVEDRILVENAIDSAETINENMPVVIEARNSAEEFAANAEAAAQVAQPYPSRVDAEISTVPESIDYISVKGLLYKRSLSPNPALTTNGGSVYWEPVGTVWTAHFGHIGTGLDESSQVQSALDYVSSIGGGVVFLSAPLSIGSTILIPSRVSLENPYQFVTTMLPGCRTAYGNQINDSFVVPCQTPSLVDVIIDGQNLPDAWHGIRFEGPYNARIIRPRIYNLTAKASTEDGAGYLEADGRNTAYSGYDDATAIFLTTHKAINGAMRRCAEWVIEHPEISRCSNGIIGTTHPEDTGSDGANFGYLVYPNIDAVSTWGVAFRFGEQNLVLHGRISSPQPTVRALFHIGDTVTTLINVGTDGIMFTSYVRLVNMLPGQEITQISVNGNNILSSPVPFNETMDQTISDLVVACQEGPASEIFNFGRSSLRPALWIFSNTGGLLPTGSTNIVVTSDASKIVASGPTADTPNIDYVGPGVTGIRDKWGYPEGHEGSDTIGIMITDQASAEIINSGGNGPAHRLWFCGDINNLNSGGSFGKARTNHFRAADGMTYLGGGIKSAARVEATTASELSVIPANPGDWEATYASRTITRIPNGATDIIMAFLNFTPTYSNATGALRVVLPPEISALISLGNQMFLNVEQIKTVTSPTGTVGGMPRFRIQSGYSYGEVVWPRLDGTSALWSVSNITSGTSVQLRIFGHLPINR